MDELGELVGKSPALGALREQLGRLVDRRLGARAAVPVLLLGETGTGKGLVARLIHRAGPRRAGPFVNVRCAAIPHAQLEAELLGREMEGGRRGLVEAARGGTLYLDEVGVLSGPLQAGLLEAIDPRRADVCVIGGTHTRRARGDLNPRLAGITLDVPPLRERGRDVLMLAARFLARFCDDYDVAPKRLDRSAQAALLGHDWPGNVRELANIIERAVLVSDALVVTADTLGLPALGREAGSAAIRRDEALRRHLETALTRTDWNIARTAALLGVARNTVYAHIQKFGMRRRSSRSGRAAPPAPVDGRLRWERRSVTLLHACVGRAAAPASVAESAAALETFIEKVDSFGAHLEELTPTSVVAAFGLDDVAAAPCRAAHAALAIHKAIERGRRDGRPVSAVEIGVHVAPLLVGRAGGRVAIDADGRRAQLPVLEGLRLAAAPGETVVSATAAPFLQRHFELAPAGAAAYRLTGRERRGLDRWGPLSPFVGRRAEIAGLQVCLARAQAGRGQMVLVGGEAGVGKSRLMWELLRSGPGRDWQVFEMSCVPFARAAAEHPVAALLRAHFGIERPADAEEARGRVAASLRALDERLEAALPGLCAWLEIPIVDAGWQVLEPAERRRASIDAVTRLLLSQSAERPVLLLVEDVHWVDSETESLLDSLAGRLGSARLLVALTQRPGARDGWEGRREVTRVDVGPLPPAEVDRLLRGLIGDDPTLPAAKRLVAEAADGNPFFLEESVRTLVEAGALAGERGHYRASGPIAHLEVPATVEALLAARIDRLAPADRQVLQWAAAIGHEVELLVLDAVASGPEGTLRESVERLIAAELVYWTRSSGGSACTFKHALTRETAYASLPERERPDLHRRILDALETLPHRDHTDDIERLAHHAFRAGAWDRAVGYLRQAGDRAFRRWANREAEERYVQALTALERWPEGRSRGERAVDLRLALRDPLWVLGKMDDMKTRLGEALEQAERLGDPTRLGWVCCHLARHGWAAAEHPQALGVGARALRIAEATGDHALAIETRFYVGAVVLAMGECGRAAAMLRSNLAALEDGAIRLPRRFRVQGPLLHRGYLARCLAELGEFDEAIACAAAARTMADATGNPFSRVTAGFGLGNAYLRWGRAGEGLLALEEGVRLCGDFGLMNWKPALMATLGAAYAAVGRVEEGRPLIEEAVRYSERARILSSHSLWVVYLGEAWLREGRPAEARGHALRARELTRARGERGFGAWAAWLLGEIAVRDGARGDALAAYRAALDMAAPLAMHPLAARCRTALAQLTEER